MKDIVWRISTTENHADHALALMSSSHNSPQNSAPRPWKTAVGIHNSRCSSPSDGCEYVCLKDLPMFYQSQINEVSGNIKFCCTSVESHLVWVQTFSASSAEIKKTFSGRLGRPLGPFITTYSAHANWWCVKKLYIEFRDSCFANVCMQKSQQSHKQTNRTDEHWHVCWQSSSVMR